MRHSLTTVCRSHNASLFRFIERPRVCTRGLILSPAYAGSRTGPELRYYAIAGAPIAAHSSFEGP
jgi:hypothetical protein